MTTIHNDGTGGGNAPEDGAALVHDELGVTSADCPICREEPHHHAARYRTADEQAALDRIPQREPFSSDEVRALIDAGVGPTRVATIHPDGGVL